MTGAAKTISRTPPDRIPASAHLIPLPLLRWTTALLLLIPLLSAMAVHPADGSASLPDHSLPSPANPYRECGGQLTNLTGFFHTPNFPGVFPVPITCRWVIQAPEGMVICVHFTQLYLREGLRATEFLDYHKDFNVMAGEALLGDVTADNNTLRVSTNRSHLALDLRLDDMRNANLRVLDSLLDVYGFNATYEILDPRKKHAEACSAPYCQFNGNCLANSDYSSYSCNCFPGFFGDKCQYGPHCDPSRGKSRCFNGGNCTYLTGSQVLHCHCPPNFQGAYCDVPRQNYNTTACQLLGCSHRCKPNKNGVFQCHCNVGYSLTSDNRTCVTQGLPRFVASLKLLNESYLPKTTNQSSPEYLKAKKVLESKLQQAVHKKPRQTPMIKNLTVLEFSGSQVVFHYFAKEAEGNKAVLYAIIDNGTFGDLKVSPDHISFSTEHALDIQGLSVTPSSGQVMVGKELRLTCKTLGSTFVRFEWYKDGAFVDRSTSEPYGMFISLLEKTPQDIFTSVLTIGVVQRAHQGVYKCRVIDWGVSQERLLSVVVVARPRVVVNPMSLTVNQGEPVSILCTSKSIIKYGYNWARNGLIVSGSEVIEDIFPNGSRMKLPRADTSATYTCVVSGPTGETRVDSRVTVINPNVIETCPAEDYLGIHWRHSAPNTHSLEGCPAGYQGSAKRRCTKLDSAPFWEEPDFSTCVSPTLYSLDINFENLLAGLNVTTPLSLLEESFRYLKSRGSQIYPGEGAPVLDLISKIREYQEKHKMFYPSLIEGNDLFFDIISFLLSVSRAINSEGKVLQLVREVQARSLYIGRYMPIGHSVHIDREALAVDIVRKQLSNKLDLVVPVRHIKKGNVEWFTDSVVARVELNDSQQVPHSNSSIEVAVIFYRNLSRLLPKRSSKRLDIHSQFVDMEYELNSRVVTVAYHQAGQETFNSLKDGRIHVAFDRSPWEISRKGWNVTCGLANFSMGRLEWSLDNCHLVSSENATQCLCSRFGTYVVLLTTFLSLSDEEVHGRLDSVVAIGCFVGAVLILLALVSLAVCWRNGFQGFVVLKMQVCIGLLGVISTFLTTTHVALPPSMYPYVLALLEFFLLEPLSMHVCLELLLYLELVNVHHVRNAFAKISLLGWGIPSLVTGATLVVQAQEGFRYDRWWMQVGDTFFMGFSISSVILIGLYILLYLVVNLELRHKILMGSPQKAAASKRMGLLRRSLLLQVASAAVAVSSIVYSNSPGSLHRYVFAVICGLTGFLVFMLYTIKSESPGCLCAKRKGGGLKNPGVSTQSNASSSLLKLDGSIGNSTTATSIGTTNNGRQLKDTGEKNNSNTIRRCHHPHSNKQAQQQLTVAPPHVKHCILRGESREQDDRLFHERSAAVAPSAEDGRHHHHHHHHQSNIHNFQSEEEEEAEDGEGTHGTYVAESLSGDPLLKDDSVTAQHHHHQHHLLHHHHHHDHVLPTVVLRRSPVPASCPTAVRTPLPPSLERCPSVADMGLVAYEGSPKKYPCAVKEPPAFVRADIMEELMLVEAHGAPQTMGKCFLHYSPDPSPASSSTASMDGSSSGYRFPPAGSTRFHHPAQFRSQGDSGFSEASTVEYRRSTPVGGPDLLLQPMAVATPSPAALNHDGALLHVPSRERICGGGDQHLLMVVGSGTTNASMYCDHHQHHQQQQHPGSAMDRRDTVV